MKRSLIGVNIASMLPWSAIPRFGLRIAGFQARQAGFDFLQALPLRGVWPNKISTNTNPVTSRPIFYVEDAWNSTTLANHLSGDVGSQGMKTTWADVLFFPGPEECLRRKRMLELEAQRAKHPPREITHKLSEASRSCLLEVTPRHRKSVAEYKQICRSGSRLVLDTKHIRETDNGFSIWDSEEEPAKPFAALLPCCELIHVQAEDSEEWAKFLKGSPTVLGTMLRIAKGYAKGHGYDGHYVVEMKPGATGLMGMVNPVPSLSKARERVLEIVG